ncbi:Methyltransferase domain [Phytophthora infestans]|uniref:Methyltransferase domain n=1 Tax=Phytophthora infestans TaxID=4787 RepID=A0A833SRV4_PHYIN|nr:Methyltransferase domain [Phytophthora infestans]KAF4136121.1 Methyltransferase domain [Phytophthora infestans]
MFRLRGIPVQRRGIHHRQSVLNAVHEIRECLSDVDGISISHNDAKALVANALQPPLSSSSDLFFHSERELTGHEAAKLTFSVERRSKGEPLAYVIGRKEFWSLEFKVTRDTLIPRSDSEILIETLMDQFHPETPLRILDIGTGSGCLLLSALSEFPRATGVGIDISAGALAIAKENAQSNKLEERSEFLLRDLKTLPGLRSDVAEDEALFRRFDVILCNPPYIPGRELDLVGPDVLKYEPHIALFSGGAATADSDVDPKGLRMYRLLHESVDNLFNNERGDARQDRELRKNCLLVEIGSEDQAREVKELFSSSTKAAVLQSEGSRRLRLQFERYLFDTSGKYRGLLFRGP